MNKFGAQCVPAIGGNKSGTCEKFILEKYKKYFMEIITIIYIYGLI